MGTSKYVFYLIYFIFHILLIGGSIYMMNRLGVSDFEWINGFISGDNMVFNKGNIIFFSILGLILFLINVVIVNIQISSSKKKIMKLEGEINSLKAKIYDLNEAFVPTATKKARPAEGGPAEQPGEVNKSGSTK